MACKTLLPELVPATAELFIAKASTRIGKVFAYSAGITGNGLRVVRDGNNSALLQLRVAAEGCRGNGALADITISLSEMVRLRNYLSLLIEESQAPGA